MTVQLEYINHLLQFFKNISNYAGIVLNAFSDLLCSKYIVTDKKGSQMTNNCEFHVLLLIF